jgi:hypothetical protein
VTVIMPFTEGVSGEWAKEVDYSQVIAYFSELSQQLFGNIPDLKVFLYRARWKDQDLAQIELSRADYEKINLAQVEGPDRQAGGADVSGADDGQRRQRGIGGESAPAPPLG